MDPSFPIGTFRMPPSVTPELRKQAIDAVAALPAKFRAAVNGWSDERLDTPYREGGWTVRQLVHHVPDSHVNAFVRLKLALTEEKPTIRPYDQDRWAKLADARMPIEVSLRLLEAVHQRWDVLWRSLAPGDFARALVHPEHGDRTVDWILFLYEWHGKHHTAHITELARQKGW